MASASSGCRSSSVAPASIFWMIWAAWAGVTAVRMSFTRPSSEVPFAVNPKYARHEMTSPPDGRSIHMELCASCDAGDVDRPAAGLLLQFFASGGGQDETRAQEASQLLMEWTKECMAAHGWHWQETPPDQP